MVSYQFSHCDKVFECHFWIKCAFHHSEMIDLSKIGRASSKRRLFLFKSWYMHLFFYIFYMFLLFFSTFSVSHTPETFENDDGRAVALQAPLPCLTTLAKLSQKKTLV